MELQGGKSVGTPNLQKLAKKDIKTTLIPLKIAQLDLKQEKHIGLLANYQINKPSNLPSTFQPLQVNWPKVCLDLKRPEDIFQLSIIQNISHKNIMRMEAVKEISTQGKQLLAVFLECNSGPLSSYLPKLSLLDNNGLVPTQGLINLIRQIINGVEVLRINGYYHGSLSMDNIYYCNEGHAIIIKLVNFQMKEMEKEIAQLEDWNAIGSFLDYISAEAKSKHLSFIYSVIDDLALKLMALTDVGSLQTIKEETLNHPFFWDQRRRIKFFVHDIPKALEDPTFVNKVYNYNAWQLPWDINPHHGLVKVMNKYRSEVLEITEYDGNDPVHNIRCMSGGYTHSDKFEGKLVHNGKRSTVDAAVQMTQPRLCIVLHELLTDEA